MKKKGISPVVASILLVVIVLVLAIIIWLWISAFFQEKAEKFGKSEDQACEEVVLEATYNSDDSLDIINRGNIPVYSLRIEVIEKGSSEVKEYDHSDARLNEGESIRLENIGAGGKEKLNIIPVLLGKSKGIKKTFICDEKYGKEVFVQ